jgi:ATP-binding cassette subfamily B protein
MRHLKKTARKFRALMLFYFALGLAMAFLQSFSARYFQRVIDSFTDGTLTVTNIAVYGGAMFALYIIGYLDNYPDRKLAHGITLSLKTDALRKLSVIDYLAYVKLGTGALIQRIENGAAAGCNILYGFWLRLASNLIPEMLFSVTFIFVINRTVTLTILLSYVFVFILSNLLLKALYKVKARILVNEEMFNHFLVRGFMETVVFRLNRRFAAEIRKAEAASGEIVGAKVRMTLIHEAFFTIFALWQCLVKIGIIAYGWSAKALSIGEIVALVALVDNAYVPIAIFNVIYVDYKLDKVAYARYAEFLDAKEDGRLNAGKKVEAVRGDISFSNVSFNYGGREIFNGLDLHIQPGKATAFVGESGSGKSTAVKLLAGLLHPAAGNITVDGINLRELNLNSYYEHIAYLPQEPPVFDGTLRENLVFDEAASETALTEAIAKAGLSCLYAKLPDGFHTPLGERGVTLSGGERQQLALARLWFSDAGLVIFDEATSSIDNLTEEAVMSNVMTLLNGRTVIAVAHRLDSVKDFHRIVVFREGKIAEQGRFEELIEKRGHFFELYSRMKAKGELI